MDSIQITARVTCHRCSGSGLIRGALRRITGGTCIREERDCEACSGRGHRVEQIELDGEAIAALGNALDVMRSAEYAETVAPVCTDNHPCQCPRCQPQPCDENRQPVVLREYGGE